MTGKVDDQLKIYKTLSQNRIKLLLVFVAVIVFLTLFVFFLIFVTKEKYTQCLIVGGSDGIFAIIVWKVYGHYFK
ncbi:MAG: hypothetical protein ACOXZV_08420 [Bacteroidales bacterium]|jgi:capsular polysaccharide biosynthesis protein